MSKHPTDIATGYEDLLAGSVTHRRRRLRTYRSVIEYGDPGPVDQFTDTSDYYED